MSKENLTEAGFEPATIYMMYVLMDPYLYRSYVVYISVRSFLKYFILTIH